MIASNHIYSLRAATHRFTARLVLLLLFAFTCITGSAQQFTVSGFRALPNDVSAFIHPVRDLNGNACALLKVQATADFAFSTPLGIVKRLDPVGEIWLYVPQGTHKLTIKHPRWGVLRDYELPVKLESHVTYELTLHLPPAPVELKHDTIIRTCIERDTVTKVLPRQRVPLSFMALATAGIYAHGPSWGVMLVLGKRNGGYVHFSSDCHTAIHSLGDCDDDGRLADNATTPYYSGTTAYRYLLATAGATHRLSHNLYLFEGIGYGKSSTYWQLAPSEGGGYLRNTAESAKGMAAETGLIFAWHRLCFSAAASTVRGKYWQAQVGIGFKIK